MQIFLRDLALILSLLPQAKAYRVRSPDINMDSLAWEIKCPSSQKLDKFRQNISSALQQSENIIVGTFRTKTNDEKIIKYITDYLKSQKKIKHLKVVTKAHKTLDLR